MLALVPLHHGRRILGRSTNCYYLPGHLRHKTKWNRIDVSWLSAEMYPIRILLRQYRSGGLTNHKGWSRCDLCVFDLGRSRPGVCFTGNAHICSCFSMYRDSGVSFGRLGSVYDHSFCSALLPLQLISLVGADQTCPPNPLHLAGSLSQLSHLPWACTNMQRIWWWWKGFEQKSSPVSSASWSSQHSWWGLALAEMCPVEL